MQSNTHNERPQQNRGRINAEQHPEQERPMTSDDIADAYADLADKLDRWKRLDRLFAGRYRRQQFEKATGRVLDVACGTGKNVQYLTNATAVVGIDISEEMLAHARDEIDYVRWGVAVGRKGWLTPDQCLNAKSLSAFTDWVERGSA
jgi:SAM-dependent methyltransferase